MQKQTTNNAANNKYRQSYRCCRCWWHILRSNVLVVPGSIGGNTINYKSTYSNKIHHKSWYWYRSAINQSKDLTGLLDLLLNPSSSDLWTPSLQRTPVGMMVTEMNTQTMLNTCKSCTNITNLQENLPLSLLVQLQTTLCLRRLLPTFVQLL